MIFIDILIFSPNIFWNTENLLYVHPIIIYQDEVLLPE